MDKLKYLLFDWGDTLMADDPSQHTPMYKWDIVSAMSGVVETMPKLALKYTCIAASNAVESNADMMKLAFERVCIDQYFKHFLTSKELGASKPSIQFFEGILKMVGGSPKNSIMIGNDYIKDIVGAKNAGLSTILITTAKVDYPYADWVVSSFEELNNIL